MDGFLLVDKPKGMTSHDVISLIKKRLKLDKIGHTGTLDPFASGLLILCLGKATKLAYLFQNEDKTYQGTMLFGYHYDTYDTTGTIMDKDIKNILEDDLIKAMKDMEGTYDQYPPMYSAIKQDGKKLYELARKGIEVERKTKEVHIYAFYPTSSLEDHEIKFFAHVSKGTYIRSLAVDLAFHLHTLAALKELRRMKIGSYDIKHAKTINDVSIEDIITLDTFFKNVDKLVLNDYMIKLVKNGIVLDERQITTEKPFIVVDQQGKSIAYYEPIGLNKYASILIF